MGAGCWNMGFGEQTWEEDCCWRRGESLRGQEWGALQSGILLEESQTTIEVKCHCWVTRKGQGHHYSLSPHTPAPASAGTRRGSHWSMLASPRQSPPPPPPTWVSTYAPVTTSAHSCLGGEWCLRVAHMQRWGWKQSWAPGAVQLRKNSWNRSLPLHKPRIKPPWLAR